MQFGGKHRASVFFALVPLPFENVTAKKNVTMKSAVIEFSICAILQLLREVDYSL